MLVPPPADELAKLREWIQALDIYPEFRRLSVDDTVRRQYPAVKDAGESAVLRPGHESRY